MTKVETNKVPPDGGYGWIVTMAYALNNVVVLPLITSFTLLLNDSDLTDTQVTYVVVLNHSIGMLVSFLLGPLLSRFGYRKMAVTGAILKSLGLLLTAGATAGWQFIFTYSIICSMGVASIMLAFTLAINSFFKEKRGRAIGVGMSITGLGSIYMPLLISTLMSAYGWRYATLILSAICLHSLVAACLLRPAKWYLKDPPSIEEAVPLNKESDGELTNGISSQQIDESTENGVLPSKSLSTRSLDSSSSIPTKNALSQESSIQLNKSEEPKNNNCQEIEESERSNKKKGYFTHFVQIFDLTLLSDPVFINIIFGLSIAACVEISFSLLFPLIIKDLLKFNTEDTAQLMSIIGFSDTLFRFVSPFIGEWCNKSPRVMYMVSLLMIIFTRSMMLFTTSFKGMIFIAVALGITKAARTVYVNLVIPTYVPIHRLPFASGLQSFFNGIAILTIGTLLSRVREATGSYVIPIIMLNFVTLLPIITWSAEFLYVRVKKRREPEQQNVT